MLDYSGGYPYFWKPVIKMPTTIGPRCTCRSPKKIVTNITWGRVCLIQWPSERKENPHSLLCYAFGFDILIVNDNTVSEYVHSVHSVPVANRVCMHSFMFLQCVCHVCHIPWLWIPIGHSSRSPSKIATIWDVHPRNRAENDGIPYRVKM